MATSYLDRGEGRLGYDVRGDGPLVVCLPGMGDLRRLYRFLVPALVEAGFRVATMDLRGHGDSDDGFSRYDDVAAGSDILALIQHLGGPALVVGNSMSAGASVLAAADAAAPHAAAADAAAPHAAAPHAAAPRTSAGKAAEQGAGQDDGKAAGQAVPGIAGLALIGPFVRNPKVGALLTLAMRVALVKPWGPAVWRVYYRSLYKTRPPADLADHQRLMADSFRRGAHWRSFVRTSRTSHAPVEARLGEVRTPTLVIMGEKDSDFPDPAAEARFVADALGGEVLLVTGAGHYPLVEYPEIVNPAIVAFARQVYAVA